jgi:hypothetical protein
MDFAVLEGQGLAPGTPAIVARQGPPPFSASLEVMELKLAGSLEVMELKLAG